MSWRSPVATPRAARALAYLDTGSSEGDDTDRTGTDTSSSGWLKRVFPGKHQSDVAAASPATTPAADASQTVAAADVGGDAGLPRQPRPRPDSDAGGETVVASLETDIGGPAVPLPRSRPDSDASSHAPAGSAEDAIASLTERMNQESPTSTADSADPIALAFAAASEAPQPSAADRAILTAFATLQNSKAVQTAGPGLTDALRQLSEDSVPQQQQPDTLAVAYADTTVQPPPAAPETTSTVADAEPGIILPPAEPVSYDGDEHTLVHLIETPVETPASASGQFAMPKPASGLYLAPERRFGGCRSPRPLRSTGQPVRA